MNESDYNKLSEAEINDLLLEIDGAMRTTNGDTGPVQLTARQAAVLLWSYRNNRRPISENVFA